MKPKKKIPFEAIMVLVVLCLIAIMAFDGFVVQDMPSDARSYPIFVFVVIAIAGAVEIANAFRKQNDEKEPVFENRANFFLVAGMIIAYAVAMYLIGFVLSTILFVAIFIWKFKMKHALLYDIGAAAVIIAIYFCFKEILYVFLPSGVLLDKIF